MIDERKKFLLLFLILSLFLLMPAVFAYAPVGGVLAVLFLGLIAINILVVWAIAKTIINYKKIAKKGEQVTAAKVPIGIKISSALFLIFGLLWLFRFFIILPSSGGYIEASVPIVIAIFVAFLLWRYNLFTNLTLFVAFIFLIFGLLWLTLLSEEHIAEVSNPLMVAIFVVFINMYITLPLTLAFSLWKGLKLARQLALGWCALFLLISSLFVFGFFLFALVQVVIVVVVLYFISFDEKTKAYLTK